MFTLKKKKKTNKKKSFFKFFLLVRYIQLYSLIEVQMNSITVKMALLHNIIMTIITSHINRMAISITRKCDYSVYNKHTIIVLCWPHNTYCRKSGKVVLRYSKLRIYLNIELVTVMYVFNLKSIYLYIKLMFAKTSLTYNIVYL